MNLIALAFIFFQAHATIADVSVRDESYPWVSEWMEFTVPSGVSGFQILAVGSPETPVQVTDLIDPAGFAYVESDANPQSLNSRSMPIVRNVKSPNRSEAVMPGTATLIVPNNPLLPTPRPGRWRMRLHFHAKPEQKTARVEFKWMRNRTLGTPAIDVAVWVAPGSYWADDPAMLQTVLSRAREIYAEYGLELNITANRMLRVAPAGPLDLPGAISEIARKTNDRAVINAYFMGEMRFQNKAVNGLACLGGPVDTELPHSCSVSLYARAQDADTITIDQKAKILVHELGHYLGLFHTRDDGYMFIGSMYDAFTDTPEIVTGGNLMDPGIHDAAPVFTPMQQAFLLNSPALRSEKAFAQSLGM